MKHLYMLSALFLSLTFLCTAQDSLRVTEQQKQMSRGMQNGFVIDIPQARLKDVVKAWEKYISRDTKADVVKADDEYRVAGTVLSNISAKPMNVYTRISEMDNAIRVAAYFEEDSAFIASAVSAEKAQAAEKLMRDFARLQYRQAVENEVEREEKKLSELENERESLIKSNEKAEKSIGNYERKIDRAKGEIESNASAQSKRRMEISDQKEVLRAATPKTETYALEEKKLNGLEKELKKLVKEGERLHSDIDDWNAEIRSLKRNIEKTEDRIKEKKNAISDQKDHVKAVRKKMENIK